MKTNSSLTVHAHEDDHERHITIAWAPTELEVDVEVHEPPRRPPFDRP